MPLEFEASNFFAGLPATAVWFVWPSDNIEPSSTVMERSKIDVYVVRIPVPG